MSGKAILKEIGSTLLYIVVVLGITWLVITFVGQRTEVNGSSMEPTLSNNDNLIVDKISYRFKDPQRFDIIVFPFQYDENVYYIKRIIGLPGETVQIGTDGTIYIDGQVLERLRQGSDAVTGARRRADYPRRGRIFCAGR